MTSSTQPAPGKSTHCWHLALAIILGTSLLRWWYSTQIDLLPDEAYYWVWSKHLAASYRDKGPAIAWVIALGTWIFGDNAFGIRFFAVTFGALTGWQLFVLGKRLGGERTGLWCVILVNVIPLLAVGSLLMTIDVLSLFSWVWAMNVLWTALDTRKSWQWFGLGVIIGLGFLAKFTNGIQLVCIVGFLLWSKPHRDLFFSRQTTLMGLGFSLAILPVIWWNAENGWIHAGALSSRSGAGESFQIRPLELLRFIGGQLLVLTPLIGIGFIVAVWGNLRKHHTALKTRFLLSHILPVYAVFGFFSINLAGKENWPAPALMGGLVMLVMFWRERIAQKPGLRRLAGITVGLSLVLTLLFHNTDLLRLSGKYEPLRRARGWHDFATHVQKARSLHKATLLIGNHYSQASMLRFCLPDQPVTYLPERPYGKNQFTLWPTYKPQEHSKVLFVTNKMRPPPEPVLRDYPKVTLVDDFWTLHQGRKMNQFQIYLCEPE